MQRGNGTTPWPAIAPELGFEEALGDERARNGYALGSDGRWLRLRRRGAFAGDPLRDLLGRPGFWRALRSEGGTRLVFDLPLYGHGELEPGDDPDAQPEAAAHPIAALLDWAERCEAPSGVTASAVAPEELDVWFPPSLRSVRAGSQLVQVELVADGQRLALEIPRLLSFSTDLSPARESWLRELCHDAQASWRLVRFGLVDCDESQRFVCAEVDLTGAPAPQLPSLFPLALTALRSSATWALPGLALIANSRVESRLLDRRPPRAERRDGQARTD